LLTKFIKLTLLLLGICVLSAAPVFADTTTFTFVPPPLFGVSDLGHSHTFHSTGAFSVPLTASGFFFNGNFTVYSPTDLSAKNFGGPDVGLGLIRGFSNEISSIPHGSFSLAFVQLDIGDMLKSLSTMLPPGGRVEDVTLKFNSVTPPPLTLATFGLSLALIPLGVQVETPGASGQALS
jgi:hypothetical protein